MNRRSGLFTKSKVPAEFGRFGLQMNVNEEWKEYFPGDNSNGNEKNKSKNSNKEDKPKKIKILIRKFTGNGTIPLHESIVLDTAPKFVTLDKEGKPDFIDTIEFGITDVLVPHDTVYTQTPIPYVFKSEEEFKDCLEYTRKMDLDALFSLVETEFRKYVDVEGYYYTLLVGDTIWSYFQDIFPYTHYIIVVGDNDAGKNSALLVYRFLGYRVFYVTSASAPNYYTALGNREEGQVTIAEDEADDIGYDKDKRNVFKTGYYSGGSIPKIETDGGRKQDNWLVYCHKWVAMEELPNNKNMKGVLDRSLVLKFVTGNPQYNIKEVIRTGKDPEYEPLYEKLMEIRKILFCFRLLHYNDQFRNVKLNVKNRAAELTKPLIRLFNKAPLTKQRIIDDLSIFINERNENKKNTFEAKLYNVITKLIGDRRELIDKDRVPEPDKILGSHTFSNEIIRDTCKEEMDGRDIDGKETAFYSPEFDIVSQKRITSILKSKFKAESKRHHIKDEVIRCLDFKQEYLDKIKAYYDMPNQIKILEDSVTDVTDVTLSRRVNTSKEENPEFRNAGDKDNSLENEHKIIQMTRREPENNTEKQGTMLPTSVTTVTSVTVDEDKKEQLK